MATVTGLTAARMLEIEAMSIVNGAVDLTTGVLTLQRHDGSTVVAGNVRGVGLQPGGLSGQTLVKKTNLDYDAEWRDVHEVPSGGTTGQAFFKKSDTNHDAEWRNIDASDVAAGVFDPGRMAHIRSDSYTRAWFTTDPMGGWGGEHTTVVLSPPTDTSWRDKFTVRVDNITKFAVDADGNLTVGTVPYARLEDPTVLAASGTNLNSYTTAGVWHQPGNAGAAAGSNYPESLAGLLEVFASGSMVYQRYTTYAMNTSSDSRNARVWTRGRYNGNWSPWLQVSKQSNAAGRVGIQVSTANTTASAYVSFPTGRFNAGAPAVTATCHSGAANGRMVTISDPSTAGVTIYLWANGVIFNSVSWIAQEWG